MAVLDLDRNTWRTFKTNNNLSKSSFFNKADVGPTIEQFQNAVAAFKQSKGKKDLMKVFNKAQDLQKAFKKFIDLKEAKDELTPTAKSQIEEWYRELNTVTQTLATLYTNCKEKLEGNDWKQMEGKFEEMFTWY